MRGHLVRVQLLDCYSIFFFSEIISYLPICAKGSEVLQYNPRMTVLVQSMTRLQSLFLVQKHREQGRASWTSTELLYDPVVPMHKFRKEVGGKIPFPRERCRQQTGILNCREISRQESELDVAVIY